MTQRELHRHRSSQPLDLARNNWHGQSTPSIIARVTASVFNSGSRSIRNDKHSAAAALRDQRGHGRADCAVFWNEEQIQGDIKRGAGESSKSREPSQAFGYVISALGDADKNEQNRPSVNDKNIRGGKIVGSKKDSDECG